MPKQDYQNDGNTYGYGMGASGGAQPGAYPGAAYGSPYGAAAPADGQYEANPYGHGQPGADPYGAAFHGQAAYSAYAYGGQPAAQAPQPTGAAYAPPSANPTPPQPDDGAEQKRRRGPVFWIALVVALVAIALAAFFAYQHFFAQPAQRNAAGVVGQLEGKTLEEIQAELNKQVEDGMLNINILSNIEMEDGDAEAVMRIENSPANKYMFDVTITDNATGEVYYESGFLEPNYHIESGHLKVHLDKGTYPCTATFKAYDLQTEEEIGEAAALVTINVKN